MSRWLPALVLAGLFWTASGSTASAGVFEVRSCGPSSTAAYAAMNTSPGSIDMGSACPAHAQALLGGLYTAPKAGTSTVTGSIASWTISAPPGLILRRLDVRRSIGTRRETWKVSVRTDKGQILETCELNGQLVCQLGGPGAGGDNVAAYRDLNTRSVTFAMECRTPSVEVTCPGRSTPQAWIAIYGSVALLDDPAHPTIDQPSGALLAPGWHRGAESLEIGAADASGISSLTVVTGVTTLFHREPSCDFSKLQPCPASTRETVTVDTSRLPDGTHELRVLAKDAAAQQAETTAVVRIDRTAPSRPTDITVERNPDGTLALLWANPDQGTAAPIVGAHYEVCDAAGANCAASATVRARQVARVGSVAIPGGEHQVRVWLEDEAGNANRDNAAMLQVDPASTTAPRILDLDPPVLSVDQLPSRLKVTRARRSGATLTISGTIARAASARIEAQVSRSRTGKPVVAKVRVKPRHGKWTARVRLPASLKSAGAMYLTIKFPGQSAYRATTLRRQLSRRPATRGRVWDEFSVEARNGRS